MSEQLGDGCAIEQGDWGGLERLARLGELREGLEKGMRCLGSDLGND